MELHSFGSNAHAQLQGAEPFKTTPTISINHSPSIQILWSSWCDALIAWQVASNAESKLLYMGSGLTEDQLRYVKRLGDSRTEGKNLQFFGMALGEGVQGVLHIKNSTITLFTSEDISTYTPPDEIRIHHISLTSGGHVCLIASHPRYTGTSIATFVSLEALQSWLAQDISAPSPSILQTFPSTTWKQLVSNATTTTAITTTGQVFTWSHDPRYPKLLGRLVDPDTPAPIPHQIEYLSETKIVQIASGGYMAAAVSEGGELYIWGQSCPGTMESLRVLQQSDDYDADEFVKCVELKIDGKEAKVTHVAIGSGHVIVAAETRKGERAVFAAGQGGCGQLGLDGTPAFVKNFAQVKALGETKVVQMNASGWSSWVIVEHTE